MPEHRFLVWDDAQIESGDVFQKAIAAAIQSARMAVLLVSKSFCKSEFIQPKELPPLLKAFHDDGLRLFGVLIDDCPFPPAEEIEALLATIHQICRRLQQAF